MPSPITARLLETTDWSRTPLGPRAGWPATLRLAVSICQGSRFPMFVWWGPELINIYNDAYIPILGKRHPAAFGRAARGIWGEIWPVVGPQADIVMTQGEATWNDRVLLVMERQGYTEETYFTWSYSPIRDESGRVAGLFCACKEDTDSVLAERARKAATLPDEARLRASLSGGSLGAALTFEADGYRAMRDLLVAGFSRMPSFGPLERMDFAQQLADAENPLLILTALRSILRDVAALAAGAAPESILNRDAAGPLAAMARGPLGARAVALGDVTEDARTAVRQNANRLLSMDVLVDAVAG